MGEPGSGDGVRQGVGIGVLEAGLQAPKVNQSQVQSAAEATPLAPAATPDLPRTIAGLGRDPRMPTGNLRSREGGGPPALPPFEKFRGCE